MSASALERPKVVNIMIRSNPSRFCCFYGLARPKHIIKTHTKPGPVNASEDVAPKFAQPGFYIAPPHLNFENSTFKFGIKKENGMLK